MTLVRRVPGVVYAEDVVDLNKVLVRVLEEVRLSMKMRDLSMARKKKGEETPRDFIIRRAMKIVTMTDRAAAKVSLDALKIYARGYGLSEELLHESPEEKEEIIETVEETAPVPEVVEVPINQFLEDLDERSK